MHADFHYFLSADEIKELWAEYENNSSIEASIVKDFDKVWNGLKSVGFLYINLQMLILL